MNPRREPAAADRDRPSAFARRVGPAVVIGSLLLTAALLLWMGLAPTAVAGPLEDAPFEVPGTLVTDPGPDGCFSVVDGTGQAVEHCVPIVGDDYVGSYFNAEGQLMVHTGGFDTVVEVDPATGEVLRDVPRGEWDRAHDDELRILPLDEEEQRRGYVTTDGDQVVRRFDSGYGDESFGPAAPPLRDDEVLLDLDGPPGYELDNGAVSPDGRWVLAVTPRGEVVVAPADGAAPPRVWAQLEDEDWLDLDGAIRWDEQVP